MRVLMRIHVPVWHTVRIKVRVWVPAVLLRHML